MHPLLDKILFSEDVQFQDFEDLQKIPRDDLPELDSNRMKRAVWQKFCACREKEQKALKQLIKRGERIIKQSKKASRPSASTPSSSRVLPDGSGDAPGALSTVELQRARDMVTMTEDPQPLTGRMSTHAELNTLDMGIGSHVEQFLHNEDGFPAIDFSSLGDLPGIMSHLGTSINLPVTSARNDIPPPARMSAVPLDDPQPGTSAQGQVQEPSAIPPAISRAQPSPEELEILSIIDIIPPERPPPTPLEEELASLTLLPIQRAPPRRAPKRKATHQPVREISYSHYYARSADPEYWNIMEEEPPLPVSSFLVNALRAMPLEEARRIGDARIALMRGSGQTPRQEGAAQVPEVSPDLFQEQATVQEIVESIAAVPEMVVAENGARPSDPEILMEIDEPVALPEKSASTSETDTPRIPPPHQMNRFTYSTPAEVTRHIPMADFCNLNEMPEISIPRNMDRSAMMNLPSFNTTAGTTMPLLQSHLAERLSFVEPTAEKIKFLQEVFAMLQLRDRVLTDRIITVLDNRLSAAWKFRLLVEFHGRLWHMEKDEVSCRPIEICKLTTDDLIEEL